MSLNFLCQAMTTVEIYLIFRLMGANIGLLSAFIFDALMKLVNAIGTINPGNVGTSRRPERCSLQACLQTWCTRRIGSCRHPAAAGTVLGGRRRGLPRRGISWQEETRTEFSYERSTRGHHGSLLTSPGGCAHPWLRRPQP